MSKKSIILDLDGTLWGGVVGEDGPRGIQLSVTPPGSYYLAFQQGLLDLYNRGIILAINSSNNYEDAMEAIRTNPNMLLKEANFAATRINWSDKTLNIREIAAELKIGLDSMVFLDDNPINRAAMREFVPEVETPELPQNPSEYLRFLNSLPYFETNALTNEDTMRGNMYVTERLRREHKKSFDSEVDFLSSLSLEVTIYRNDSNSLPRLAQLTEKTNQFNTNKIPLSEQDLVEYLQNPEYTLYHASASDTFGDHGIVAFALVKKELTSWKIEQLLMSCRVLGRGIEESFVSSIAQDTTDAGATKLSVVFIPTEKNKPAEDFVNKIFSERVALTQNIHAPKWVHIKRL